MPVQILRRLKGWKTSLHRKRAFFRIRFLVDPVAVIIFRHSGDLRLWQFLFPRHLSACSFGYIYKL